MANPWDGLPSIWDGWVYQTCGAFQCFDPDADIFRSCAIGFLREVGLIEVHYDPQRNVVIRCDDAHALRRMNRVDDHLDKFLDSSIVDANDHLKWTPEQFRDLDRRLEYEYQQQQLGKQIDAIESPDFTDRKVEFADRKVDLVEV